MSRVLVQSPITTIAELNTTVTVYGKKYKLQHPGTRAWMRLKRDMVTASSNSSKGFDVKLDPEKVLDYFFEHVCFPEIGEKLSIDTILPSQLEVWTQVSNVFLGGELGQGGEYPEPEGSSS
jgi:hypothetical protein